MKTVRLIVGLLCIMAGLINVVLGAMAETTSFAKYMMIIGGILMIGFGYLIAGPVPTTKITTSITFVSEHCSYKDLFDYLKLNKPSMITSNYIVGWYQRSNIDKDILIPTYREFNRQIDADEFFRRVEDSMKESKIKWPVIHWTILHN